MQPGKQKHEVINIDDEDRNEENEESTQQQPLHHNISHPRQERLPSSDDEPVMKRARGNAVTDETHGSSTSFQISIAGGVGGSSQQQQHEQQLLAERPSGMRSLLDQLRQQQQQSVTGNEHTSFHQSNHQLFAVIGQLQAAQQQQSSLSKNNLNRNDLGSTIAQQLLSAQSNQQQQQQWSLQNSGSSSVVTSPSQLNRHGNSGVTGSQSAPPSTISQWMAIQPLLGGISTTNINNVAAYSTSVPLYLGGAINSNLASSSASFLPTSSQREQEQQPSNATTTTQNQTSPIIPLLVQLLRNYYEGQRRTLEQQQEQAMQIMHRIQNNADPQQYMQFLMQLLSQQQAQRNEQESQLALSNIVASSHQHMSPQRSPLVSAASIGSNESGSKDNPQSTLQQLFAQSTGGSQTSSDHSTNRVPVVNESGPSWQTNEPSNFQMQPFLQMIAAHQARNQADSTGSTTGTNSARPTNPSALLQLLSPTWSNMHDGSLLFPTELSSFQQLSAAVLNSGTIPSGGSNSSSATSSGTAPDRVRSAKRKASRNTILPPAPISSVPPRVAARNQQVQLMESLRAAVTSGVSVADSEFARAASVEDLRYAIPDNVFDNRSPDGRAVDLPILLVMPHDHTHLSAYQTLLRYQIEVFRANAVDAGTHQRGRNRPIRVGQIGFRCRHCKHLPISDRPRGSSYFPSEVEGVYQAAQNMNTTHFQHGVCTEMGEPLRRQFASLSNTKATSTGAGRAYWAQQARALGLENNTKEGGIRFWRDTGGET